jgi:hypothetical protein
MAVPVKIKHAGKTYDLEVDTSASATLFKDQIYQKTGVPVDKVKVPVKGGMLKVSDSTFFAAVLSSRCLSADFEEIRLGRRGSQQTWSQSCEFCSFTLVRSVLTRSLFALQGQTIMVS